MIIFYTVCVCSIVFGIVLLMQYNQYKKDFADLVADANERIQKERDKLIEVIMHPESEESALTITEIKFRAQFEKQGWKLEKSIKKRQ